MKRKLIGLGLVLLTSLFSQAQGLTGITVEKYYISNAADAAAADADAASNGIPTGQLPVGSVTYRIYANLATGYNFQAVYGVAGHALKVTTTTLFYNHSSGSTSPTWTESQVKNNILALDSWFSAGGATTDHLGILKADQTANIGSVTPGNAAGILLNNPISIGKLLTTADGMMAGTPQAATMVGSTATLSALNVFDAGEANGSSFISSDFSAASLNGSTSSDNNKVLVAQFTTDGTLHFEFNIQVGTPGGGIQNFVAGTAQAGETQLASLTYTSPVYTPVVASISGKTNVTSIGGSNGTATVAATGGLSPYFYSWSGSGGTGATGIGFSAGTYTVTVTDANNSSATATATITQPTVLGIDVASFGNAPCGHNGFVTVAVTGGVTPYTYSWTSNTGLTGASGLTTGFASSLTAGSYSVTVTDNGGATISTNQTITSAGTIVAPVAPGSISGATTVFCGTNQTYSVKPVTNKAGQSMVGYLWSLPAGDSIVSGQGTASIVAYMTLAGSAGAINVSSEGTCANIAGKPLTIKSGVLAVPGGIVGSTSVFNGINGVVYSAKKVSNATSYIWTVPTGMTIASGQNKDTITVNIGASFTGGNLSVVASNGCSQSLAKTAAIKQSLIAKTGSITGSKSVLCGTSAISFSTKTLAGAVSYVWSVPAGATIASGQGTTVISVNFLSGFTGGAVTVYAKNIGDSTLPASYNVAQTKLATPSKILGPVTVYCNSNSLQYIANPVTFANTYLWTVPTGMSIASGQGHDTITVNILGTFAGGVVTVEAGNGCSYGVAKSLTVGRNKIATPVLTGPALVLCNSTGLDYNITPVTGASKYTWTVPSGAVISGGQGTTGISVNFGSVPTGTITVTADGCDSSVFSKAATLAVKAATITAPASVTGTTAGLGVLSSVQKYSVPAMPGLTTTWTESANITLVKTSANTDTLYVSFTSAFKTGTVTAAYTNGCTSSKATSLALTNKSGMDLHENAQHETALGSVQLMTISNLYPNPSTSGSSFSLEILASDNVSALVQIYDIMGNLVSSKQIALNKGSNTLSNTLYVPAGLYLMKVTDANNTETYTKRLVIQ